MKELPVIDPVLERLRRVSSNEPLCRFVEDRWPQVHTDLVDELVQAAEGLDDIHVWCPDPKQFSFYALYRGSGVVFAFAAGMQSVSLRLPPARVSEAPDGLAVTGLRTSRPPAGLAGASP